MKKIVQSALSFAAAISLVVGGTANISPLTVEGKTKTKVSGVKKYKKTIAPKKIRSMLYVPKKATVKIKYYKKHYHRSTGSWEVPVSVIGTGKYKGYRAGANISLKHKDKCCSILDWGKYD